MDCQHDVPSSSSRPQRTKDQARTQTWRRLTQVLTLSVSPFIIEVPLFDWNYTCLSASLTHYEAHFHPEQCIVLTYGPPTGVKLCFQTEIFTTPYFFFPIIRFFKTYKILMMPRVRNSLKTTERVLGFPGIRLHTNEFRWIVSEYLKDLWRQRQIALISL